MGMPGFEPGSIAPKAISIPDWPTSPLTNPQNYYYLKLLLLSICFLRFFFLRLFFLCFSFLLSSSSSAFCAGSRSLSGLGSRSSRFFSSLSFFKSLKLFVLLCLSNSKEFLQSGLFLFRNFCNLFFYFFIVFSRINFYF